LHTPASRQGHHRACAYGAREFPKVKGVGSGVFEYKIDFISGYRIYFGKDGDRLVILIGGGGKKRQQQDIAAAQECWAAHKRRK
jgi:putative addiction module killer protein